MIRDTARRPDRRRLGHASALLFLVLVTTACAVGAQSTSPSTTAARRDATDSVMLARITVEAPLAGPLTKGLAVIRFRTEHVSIESPFLPVEQRRSPLPSAHVHVSVDGAAWHWIHASTDPVVVTPLPPGEHTVELELAGADHKRLAVQSVRFTVPPKVVASVDHAAHP